MNSVWSRLRFVLRFFRRELVSGELNLLALAIVVAVAAVTSVAFFADRVERGLRQEATRLLAADLVLSSDKPLRERYGADISKAGFDIADTISFPSMVFSRESAQLSAIKVVSTGYPLRGNVEILQNGKVVSGRLTPQEGTVWLDERLLARLNVKVGDVVRIGNAEFRIAAQLIREPDGAVDVYNFVPRVMFHHSDLARTALVQEGSRLRYRLLIAGESRRLERLQKTLETQLQRGDKIERVEDARPEVRVALERAQRFLGLTALLAVALAAVAMALACRRYLARHYAPVATLRCLGATQNEILFLFSGQFIVLTLVAGGVGCVVAWLTQEILLLPFASLLGTQLPPAGWMPWVSGLSTGMLLLLGFAIPPLLQLRQAPTLRVLREDIQPQRAGILAYAAGATALFALMLWQAGDVKVASLVAGGFLAFIAVSAALAWVMLGIARRLTRHGSAMSWHYGIAQATRRPSLTLLQIVALSSGIMALLVLMVVRGDLLEAWQRNLPPDAPNHFVINIQQKQLDPVADAFVNQGLPVPDFAPMIRGRLLAINGKPVRPQEYRDERTQRLAEREFNLSWNDTLPKGNRLVAGTWWEPGASAQFSMERDIAERLGIKLGDELKYEIAGTEYQAPVTSIREVDWDSFRVNFFAIASPALLQDRPASYITSFHLPEDREDAVTALVQAFPNLTIIDVSAILAEVRSMVDKLVLAIQFVFGFSLLAGVLVLWAAIHTTRDERAFDAAVLRTLGASRQQLIKMHRSELIALGVAAGGLAAFGASALSIGVATWLLDLPVSFNPMLFPLGIAIGVFATWAAGMPAVRHIAKVSPLAALRQFS